jgi:hypothetical protein
MLECVTNIRNAIQENVRSSIADKQTRILPLIRPYIFRENSRNANATFRYFP